MPAPSISRQFDQVARSHPDAVALVSSGKTLTYTALRQRVDALAHALINQGVGAGDPVGICVRRSVASVTAVLGVLRAGAVYVPMDPDYPAERQRWMASDAQLRATVVDGVPPDWAARSVDLRGLPPADPPWRESALLNILYTSGSTGRPKGVVGTQAAMLGRLRWGWETLPFREGEVTGHRSSLNFVDAGPELFAGLLRGVPTAILHPDEVADLGRLVAALRDMAVTRLTVVPSLLAALLRAFPALGASLPDLRTWITSGEALKAPLLQAFRAAHREATLVNLYGTTEVTGDVTAAIFRPTDTVPRDVVPIGAAIAGAELLVLHEGDPVSDGTPGELHVGGPVLAQGYHRRPQEEAVRFPRHPLRPAERVFRTGDVVRKDPDGTVYYLGRTDNVVKIRGVRVELEEIDRCLAGAAEVAAVLGEEGLVAFVAPDHVDTAALRATAQRLLPAVMVPGRFIPLPALPTLPNGKVDRRALSALAKRVARDLPHDQLPRTATERHLAATWSRLLRRDDIGRDDTFAGLGGDSLTAAELMVALEPAAVDLGLAQHGTLAAVATALDGGEVATRQSHVEVTLTPLGAHGARDPDVVAMIVQASADPVLCAATELPAGLDAVAARAWCEGADGVVLRVDGAPVGAGVVQHHPNIGAGVDMPEGAVQLDEWLLAGWRGRDLLGPQGAWPQLAAWLAQRFDREVSVVWEDHLAMLAILKARGYQRLGRTWWESAPDGDGTSGFCEVWTCDLRPYR